MSDLQDFVTGRHEVKPDSRRQVIGNQHRVPVPVTRLQRPESRSSNQRPKHNLTTGPALPGLNFWSSESNAAHSPNGFADGFDTDAEGLEDTTIISNLASYDGQSRDGCVPGHLLVNKESPQDRDSGHGIRGMAWNGMEPLQIDRRLNQLEVNDLTMEADDESYEGSANEEGDEESVGEGSLNVGILRELNSPGYAQYRQQGNSHSKQAVMQSLLASSATRNELVLRKMTAGVHRTVHPVVPKRSNASDAVGDPEARLHRADPQRVQMPTRQPLQPVPERSQNGSIKQPQHSDHLANTLQQSSISILPSLTMPQDQGVADHDRRASREQPRAIHENVTAKATTTSSLGLPGKELPAGEDEDLNVAADRVSTDSAISMQTRKRALDLDYSLEQLSSMTFIQLSSESFDVAPKEPVLPQKLRISPLTEQLKYVLRLSDSNSKARQRRGLFDSLPIEQHEECGDLMIVIFAEILTKYKDTRQQRRKIAKDFEGELAQREERVRKKKNAVEQDLGNLKRGGEQVVRGMVA
ncbi:hypothetical protein MMC28_011731 [Mycoblastus sanguinarius]|nr:hypothetical protein [Mycoblastus sanguinarius]